MVVLNEVKDGVDFPADYGVFGVVAEADSQHAENSTRLHHLEAVLLPHRGRVKRELARGFHRFELLHSDTAVLILEVGVAEQITDTLCSAIHVEIDELPRHCILL